MIRELWTEGADVTFHGRFLDYDDVSFSPAPRWAR